MSSGIGGRGSSWWIIAGGWCGTKFGIGVTGGGGAGVEWWWGTGCTIGAGLGVEWWK